MDIKIEPSWKAMLQDEFKKPYFEELAAFVRQEYQTKTIFPQPKAIFKAFELCPFDRVKVVILGQDPYHGAGQAHGLSFSVSKKIPMPPSLVNIYKEISQEFQKPMPTHGNLEHWAKQGVLLLNATLTVVANMAGSHQKKGWETFTNEVIRLIAEKKEHVVFLLWGAYAGDKASMIDQSKHLVLKAPHPSPLSAHRGFFGCGHFLKANQYLEKQAIRPIEWLDGF